jgi:hypothetical protein
MDLLILLLDQSQLHGAYLPHNQIFGMENEAHALFEELTSHVKFYREYLGDPKFMEKAMNYWSEALEGNFVHKTKVT